MKLCICILLISFLCFLNFKAKSQHYFSVLGTTNEWYYNVDHQIQYLHGQYEYDEYKYSVKFYTSGDTIVKGQTYKKLYLEVGNSDFYYFCTITANNLCALLREDTTNRSLYYINPVYYKDDSAEKLLYNFNLTSGDSFHYSFSWKGVIDSGTVQNQFGDYHYIDIKDLGRWFEGIGSGRAIFYVNLPPYQADIITNASVEHLGSTLSCFFKDGVQKYGDGICSVSAIPKTSTLYSKVHIYGDVYGLYFNYSGNDDRSFKIRIYDITGRLLCNQNISGTVSITNYKISTDLNIIPGIYVATVQSGNFMCSQKIDIH